MKKIFSLIKAVMTEDMNLFRVNTKKKNAFTKVLLPIFLVFTLMSVGYSYSELIIKELVKVNMEFVLLTLFIIPCISDVFADLMLYVKMSLPLKTPLPRRQHFA